jgi:hypothetical protein
MHHSEQEGDVMRRLREELQQADKTTLKERMEAVEKQLQLGATGQFPEGKLGGEDEGEIRLAVGVHEGNVVVNFGKPVAWIGFSPQQARELAESIRQASYRATDGEAKK